MATMLGPNPDGGATSGREIVVPDGAWPADMTLCVMHERPVLIDDAGFRGRGAWAGQALCQPCADWLHRIDTHGQPAPWEVKAGEEGAE